MGLCAQKYFFVFCLSLVILPSGHAASLNEFQLTTEENPPFNFTDSKTGKFVGIATELLEEAFKRASVSYTITPLPWSRAYNLALNNKRTCVFVTAFTEDRKPLFKWVGPLTSVEWVVFGRAGKKYEVKSIDDLKKIRVGGYQDDAPTVFLKKQGVKIDIVIEDELNPRKLHMDRIDAWVTNNIRGPLLAKKLGFPPMQKIYSIKTIDHFLACNKATDDATIAALNQKVKALRAEGFITEATNRYSKEK